MLNVVVLVVAVLLVVGEVVGLGIVPQVVTVLGFVEVLIVGPTHPTRNQTITQHVGGILFTLTSFCP